MCFMIHEILKYEKKNILMEKTLGKQYSQTPTTHWLMYTSICWHLRVLPVLHRPEVVDIGLNTI